MFAVLLAVCAAHAPAHGQSEEGAAPSGEVTVEYYYRIKWGSLDEFKRLYAKNHKPLLEAIRGDGLISEIVMEEPYNHMAGDERWDLRVTITYPDAASAIGSPQFDASSNRAWESIYGKDDPEGTRFMEEEAKRFALVEEHWDVIVQAAR